MPGKTVLLFDLGGVLVDASGLAALQALRPHLGHEEVLTRWRRSAAVDAFERGTASADAFARLFIAEWELQFSPAAFLSLFASWVRGLYPGAEELLRALRRRHTLACLTNTNAIHWAQLADVRSLFDTCVASHLTGCMKPDLAAFEKALERIGAPPADVCFFDDQLPNVVAARRIGMRSFHVRGLAATHAALCEAGLHADGSA